MKEHQREHAREDLLEMLDGRVFWSDDNWQTIWARSRDGKRWKQVPADSVDLVRFLAISQSSWQGDAF